MEGSPLRYTSCTRATSARRSSMTCIVARSPRRTAAALRFGPREARMCDSGVTFGVPFEIISAKTFRGHAKSAQRGCRNPFRASRCPSGVFAHMSGRREAFCTLVAFERRLRDGHQAQRRKLEKERRGRRGSKFAKERRGRGGSKFAKGEAGKGKREGGG